MTSRAIQLARECGFELELFNSIDGYEVVVNGKIITDQLTRFYTLAQAKAQALRDAAEHCDDYNAYRLRRMAEGLNRE